MFSLTFETEYTEYITPAMEKFLRTGKASDIRHIGLDMSLPELYIDSDGNAPSYYNKRIISFSKYYHKLERRIAKEQRRLSRMVRDSANYRKQCIKIARLHAKAKHQREDFLHQISSRLAREYDLISIEDLDMRAIKKALSFGKSVSDNGWGNFVRMLEYKCEREGSFLIRVDKWFPSSKTCFKCGHIHHELTLSDRSYICPECGNVIDRDVRVFYFFY